jgi:hypothetical protein
LSPSWLLRHALAVFLVGLFLRMGWWQWTKGESDHGTLQNLCYGVEWPIFAAFVIFWWWKMIREDLKPSGQDRVHPPPGNRDGGAGVPVPAHRPGVPAVAASAPPAAGDSADDQDDEDRELAAYNRYLASLYERDAERAKR